MDALSDVAATPWSMRDRPDPSVSFHDPAEIITPNADTAVPAGARRLRINKLDLTAHGYTDGCPQCDHTIRFGKPRPGTQHSDGAVRGSLKPSATLIKAVNGWQSTSYTPPVPK